jgi:hypothetical protein
MFLYAIVTRTTRDMHFAHCYDRAISWLLLPVIASNSPSTLKHSISIAVLLLAVTANPLLAVDPCHIDCLVSGARQTRSSVQVAAHHAGHAALPNQSQEEGKLQILPLTCGTHPTVALQVAAYIAPQAEKAGQAVMLTAAPERGVTTFTPLLFNQSSSYSQLTTAFSSKAIPLRL